MQLGKKCIIAILSLGLASCANMSNEDSGTLTGAAVGGLIGSAFGSGSGQAAAIVGGAFVGALVGNQIGRSMDRQDRMEMYHALRRNRHHHWTNRRSGHEYDFQPIRTYYQDDEEDGRETCREYRTTAYIGNKKQVIYGTACKSPNGDWEIVD